jgi:hypothetical protein
LHLRNSSSSSLARTRGGSLDWACAIATGLGRDHTLWLLPGAGAEAAATGVQTRVSLASSLSSLSCPSPSPLSLLDCRHSHSHPLGLLCCLTCGFVRALPVQQLVLPAVGYTLALSALQQPRPCFCAPLRVTPCTELLDWNSLHIAEWGAEGLQKHTLGVVDTHTFPLSIGAEFAHRTGQRRQLVLVEAQLLQRRQRPHLHRQRRQLVLLEAQLVQRRQRPRLHRQRRQLVLVEGQRLEQSRRLKQLRLTQKCCIATTPKLPG